MDDKNINLAGALSTPKVLPKDNVYIGMQSRFEKSEMEKEYDFLAIVSGPEPQRTILDKGLTKALKIREEKSLIVLGKPEEKEMNFNKPTEVNDQNITSVIDHIYDILNKLAAELERLKGE